MNTFPFVLPYYPPAMAIVILIAIVVIFTDRMWRPLEVSMPPSAPANS
jgi:hypothetical protein